MTRRSPGGEIGFRDLGADREIGSRDGGDQHRQKEAR